MKSLLESWRNYLSEEIIVPHSGFLEGSMYKDSLYHGSDYRLNPGEQFDPSIGGEYGIYLSPNRKYAKMYGEHLYEVLVNIQNPFYVEGKYQISPKDITKEDIDNLKNKGYDSIVVTNDAIENASEIVVFEPEQVHILQIRHFFQSTPKKKKSHFEKLYHLETLVNKKVDSES